MITELAQATAGLLQIINDLLHQTQSERLDAATARATNDVQNFKDDLLARRLDSVNLRLGGLQHGILVHLTDAESEQLRAIDPRIDAFTLLGLYARARAADLAAQCGQILRDTSGENSELGTQNSDLK